MTKKMTKIHKLQDLLLYDYKYSDKRKHSNFLIFENVLIIKIKNSTIFYQQTIPLIKH